jgi:hypothetical protein
MCQGLEGFEEKGWPQSLRNVTDPHCNDGLLRRRVVGTNKGSGRSDCVEGLRFQVENDGLLYHLL